MIHFECDYLEGCHPAILQKLQETNLEQNLGYGVDPHCERAAAMIRIACDAPDADVHFLVGGTQTNATILSALLRPYQGVLCASTGHINVHETGAIEHGGHKVLPLPSTDGKLTAEQVRSALEAHFQDANHEHMVQPGAVYISFPTELGTIYTKAELEALSAVCRDWEVPLFIDGARLGYGLESSQSRLLLKDIARLSDVFYIGGTKQGALFGEAVVFRSRELARDFRYLIKMNGGMLAKGRLLGIQFEALMEGGLYFKLARQADRLAEQLSGAFRAAGIELLIDSGTNQVFPILSEAQAQKLGREFGFEYWTRTPDGRDAWRFCTSWATTREQVETLAAAIKDLEDTKN
ncbi:MAG: low specificity L-threonine aldolase [Bacteroidales bacterium]|nr:low specificity L-threonine aldolase [Bacteroidales bacterium]